MIDPKATVSYAQYKEDVILDALLGSKKKGFYIDVGANYPVIDSVTKRFYDRGWTGINIEPIKSLHAQLKQARPKDINLLCGLGRERGKAVFREYIDTPGHSTFSAAEKKSHANQAHKDHEVAIETLAGVINKHAAGKKIDFIKIDVEGFEHEVVAGNDWKKHRPVVICIEANHKSEDWSKPLSDSGYQLAVSDGLNDYFIADEHLGIMDGFAERAIAIDYHALRQHQYESWNGDSNDLQRLDGLIKSTTNKLETLQRTNQELASLSLRNKPFLSRLKRAVYGLTIDWVRYARHHKKTKR